MAFICTHTLLASVRNENVLVLVGGMKKGHFFLCSVNYIFVGMFGGCEFFM